MGRDKPTTLQAGHTHPMFGNTSKYVLRLSLISFVCQTASDISEARHSPVHVCHYLSLPYFSARVSYKVSIESRFIVEGVSLIFSAIGRVLSASAESTDFLPADVAAQLYPPGALWLLCGSQRVSL